MRRAQMRLVEMKCKCEVWSRVWSVKNAMWSVRKVFAWQLTLHQGRARVMFWTQQQLFLVVFLKCEVWTVKCEMWSVKCEVWSVKCVVWSVKSAARSAKWRTKMWHVKQDTTFAECTHARAWLAHGACKFYRWDRSYIYIYIPKATSAPHRAGTTGIDIL